MNFKKFIFTFSIISLILIVLLNVTGCCTTFSPVSSAKTIQGGSYLYVDVSVTKTFIDDIPVLGSGDSRNVKVTIDYVPADAKVYPILIDGDNFAKYQANQAYTADRYAEKNYIQSGFTDSFTLDITKKNYLIIKNDDTRSVNVTVTISPA